MSTKQTIVVIGETGNMGSNIAKNLSKQPAEQVLMQSFSKIQ